MFPIEKYRFYVYGNKVIAISTYEGKTVKGVAKCDPKDEFSVEDGKRLAAARCNLKVAQKREKRARKCFKEAKSDYEYFMNRYSQMTEYLYDSLAAVDTARTELGEVLEKL